MKINKIYKPHLLKVAALFLLLGSSLIISCKKDEPNPCAGAVPFKASFQILQPIGKDSLVEVDTATINSRITFKAPKDYDSYVWLVDDKPFTNYYLEKDPTQFFLTFPDPDVYNENYFYNAKITLIAKKKPLLNCLPTDDGIDTISKNLHVKYWFKAPIFGKYFGYYGKNTKDTATVVITLKPINPRTNALRYVISNINKGCNVALSTQIAEFYPAENTWRYFYADGKSVLEIGGGCASPELMAALSPNHQDILINFSWADKSKPEYGQFGRRVFDTFTGKRIK